MVGVRPSMLYTLDGYGILAQTEIRGVRGERSQDHWEGGKRAGSVLTFIQTRTFAPSDETEFRR